MTTCWSDLPSSKNGRPNRLTAGCLVLNSSIEDVLLPAQPSMTKSPHRSFSIPDCPNFGKTSRKCREPGLTIYDL